MLHNKITNPDQISTIGAAPNNAEFVVAVANSSLTAERVTTNSTTNTWNTATPGQIAVERAALTGDVTAGANSNVTTIANDAVTFAKMQNIVTDSLMGRDSAATGDPENITLNATLSMTGAGALQRAALTGDVTAPAGSNALTIAGQTGAWTPTIRGGTTAGTYTYTIQTGRYVKIGKLVWVKCDVKVDTVTTAGTGTAVIAGLPFAPSQDDIGPTSVLFVLAALGVPTNFSAWNPLIHSIPVDSIRIRFTNSTTGAVDDAAVDTIIGAGTRFIISSIYETT